MSVDTMSIEDALTVVAVATPGSVAWKAARSVLALYERVGLNRAAWLGTREEVMRSPGDAGGFGPREQRPNGHNTTEDVA